MQTRKLLGIALTLALMVGLSFAADKEQPINPIKKMAVAHAEADIAMQDLDKATDDYGYQTKEAEIRECWDKPINMINTARSREESKPGDLRDGAFIQKCADKIQSYSEKRQAGDKALTATRNEYRSACNSKNELRSLMNILGGAEATVKKLEKGHEEVIALYSVVVAVAKDMEGTAKNAHAELDAKLAEWKTELDIVAKEYGKQ